MPIQVEFAGAGDLMQCKFQYEMQENEVITVEFEIVNLVVLENKAYVHIWSFSLSVG